jgi:NTP-dependent ternary system trypsin peptidase co-occuring protein
VAEEPLPTLTEVVARIRDELEAARTAAEGEGIGFTVDKVTLEFTVQVQRTDRGSGGLRIGVVTADLGRTVDRATTHRVQFDLAPHAADGSRISVSR